MARDKLRNEDSPARAAEIFFFEPCAAGKIGTTTKTATATPIQKRRNAGPRSGEDFLHRDTPSRPTRLSIMVQPRETL